MDFRQLSHQKISNKKNLILDSSKLHFFAQLHVTYSMILVVVKNIRMRPKHGNNCVETGRDMRYLVFLIVISKPLHGCVIKMEKRHLKAYQNNFPFLFSGSLDMANQSILACRDMRFSFKKSFNISELV